MKKNFIYMLAVALISTCMVACSSGDDSATNENTTPQKGDRQVILTGRIEKPMTRSTVDDQGNSEWQNGDQIAVRYEKSGGGYGKAVATITETGVTWAAFTATLDDPKTGDSEVTLVYPNTAYSESSPYYNLGVLNSQDGTLAGIGSSKNIQSNTATVNVSGTTATLKASVLLNTNVCISKFVLKDRNGNAVNADGLKIKYGDTEKYTVTPAAATNTFYVAMEEFSGNVSIELLGVKNYPELSAPSSLPEYGEFIVVKTDDADHQAYIERSSAANKILNTTGATLTAGEFYNQNLTVSGYERIAVTAYRGDAISNYCDYFIALALEDAIPATVTLATAQSAIGSSTWVSDHKLKISNQTYDQFQGETTEGVKGKYDEVFSNKYDNTYHMTTSESSKTRTSSLLIGWRIPSVTDFRYIFSQLKDDSNNDVIDQSKISPTSPAGIGDHNVNYHADLTNQMYRTGSTQLQVYINKLCGTDDVYDTNKLQPEYYWLSSQLLDYSVDSNDDGINDSAPIEPVAGKAWRYSFSHDYFIWNEANDKSRARLVFAY